MKHLEIFENFNSVTEAEGGAIPVYNELEFRKNVRTKPVKNIMYSAVPAELREMLKMKEMGEIEEIVVIADVPTQGKGAPDYVKDIIRQERERLAKRYKALRGQDIEDLKTDGEFDFDIERFGDGKTIFFDSEFLVDRIENIAGKDFVIGIPMSLKNKGYEAKIAPIKVEEIYFTPKK
jgi:hypothetical protein